VEGLIRLESMHPQVVTRIRLALIERYARGRGKDRLVDEYLLGELIIDEEIAVHSDEPVEMEFALPFAPVNRCGAAFPKLRGRVGTSCWARQKTPLGITPQRTLHAQSLSLNFLKPL